MELYVINFLAFSLINLIDKILIFVHDKVSLEFESWSKLTSLDRQFFRQNSEFLNFTWICCSMFIGSDYTILNCLICQRAFLKVLNCNKIYPWSHRIAPLHSL